MVFRRSGENPGASFIKKRMENERGFLSTFLLALIFLFSCTMAGTNIYNLSLLPVEERSHAGAGASVNVILRAPRYLEQPYIVYRISSYELKVSNSSRWDSSPADMVKGAIKDSLSSSGSFAAVRTSASTPSGFYRCEVNLRRFERFDKGDDSFGALDFGITFRSPEGRILYNGSLSKEAKLAGRSFSSLAKFLSEALSQELDEVNVTIIKSLP